jgi:hypothetical protein
MKNSVLKAVLDGLMSRYMDRVPDVKGVIEAMIKEGVISSASEIENDHIAFRTMGVANLGIASFEKIFLHYGFVRRDHYYFKEKKLDAYWYAPPAPEFPRIFLSELRVKICLLKHNKLFVPIPTLFNLILLIHLTRMTQLQWTHSFIAGFGRGLPMATIKHCPI